jgi:DNA-binding transcriptional LysR family regulator
VAAVRAEPLFDLTLFPVASLALALRHPEVTPALIAALPLIDHPDHPWETWFAPSGVTAPAAGGQDTFDDEQMALDMAAAGIWVALTYGQAAEPYLADGRLVRCRDLSVPTERRAWLVWREDNPKLRLIRNFSWWLRGEFGSSGGQQAGTAA